MLAYMELESGMIIETDEPGLWKEGKRLSTKEGKAKKRAHARKRLLEMLQPGDTVWTVLRHVSDSGMSRRIDLYTIKDNRPVFLSGYAADMLDGVRRHRDKQGLVVEGCGMDMGFHVVYGLSCALFCGDGYDHDKAYSLKHEWL